MPDAGIQAASLIPKNVWGFLSSYGGAFFFITEAGGKFRLPQMYGGPIVKKLPDAGIQAACLKFWNVLGQ